MGFLNPEVPGDPGEGLPLPSGWTSVRTPIRLATALLSRKVGTGKLRAPGCLQRLEAWDRHEMEEVFASREELVCSLS